MSALAFDKLISWPRKGDLKKELSILVVILLLFIGVFNSVKYHFFWSKKIDTARAFDKAVMDAYRYIETLPSEKEIFLITGSMQRIPIKVLNNEVRNISYFYPSEIKNINPSNQNNFEIIMTDRDENIIDELKKRFPKLSFYENKDDLGIAYYILK
jgi:hypothetical protein